MNKPLILIDGSSYFFRAFHALPPLTNSQGQPTGAVYGVANMIKRLLKDYQPEQVAVVLDAKGKTFRDDLYAEYKANRPPTPDELSCQFQPMLDVLDAMGLPLLIIEGVEADDVIGTLAHQASQQGVDVIISTGDKDMAQCVNQYVSLINTMTNKTMNREGVIEKFGVPPELIIDYLALIGDKVDNVPGVEKCGPKTAVKWLSQYGNLDNIIAHADEVTGKVGENLRNAVDFLPLSRQLVTIKTDLDLAINLSDLSLQQPDNARLTELVKQLEFKTWLKELLGEDSAPPPQPTDYETVTKEEHFSSWLEQLKKAEVFAFDTETTSLRAHEAQLVGISFALAPGKACYIPLAHQEETAQLNRNKVLEQLKPVFENESIKKIAQNLKYDYTVLSNYQIRVAGGDYDTMLESYVINSSGNRHDMDTLSLKYLGHKTISFEEIAGKGVKQLRFDEIPIATAAHYAAEDADITYKLHQTLYPQIEQAAGLSQIFADIDMPLVPILAKMEKQGVLIDAELLAGQSQRLKLRIEQLEQQAHEIAGESFNLSSPKQLQHILFEKLELPILQKTPKGQPSTAEPVLHELAYDYPLPKIILEYRSLSKLVSTYTEALPKQISASTGRVHTSYNQAVAATGRLSSSEPNLQNIPVRTEEGRHIRQAFIAPADHILVAADYSQIELRIMAHLSQDKGLLKAFANGWDIHRATAAEIFAVELDDVSDDQRRSSKAVNFGLIYGMSAFGLAKQLDISRQDAQSYIDLYFERYPGVLTYMDETRELARSQGYVETLYGRRLYLPEINSRNMMRRKAAERTAINAPMQGTAADIIKKAMIAMDNWISQNPHCATMIMQVHDELVFEIPKQHQQTATGQIKLIMESAADLAVPLEVSIGSGDNWEQAH